MKEKQLEICPKYDNQLEKVSLILSNSDPVRSFKAKDRYHKQLTVPKTRQEDKILLIANTSLGTSIS